jgi:hypothetical protein
VRPLALVCSFGRLRLRFICVVFSSSHVPCLSTTLTPLEFISFSQMPSLSSVPLVHSSSRASSVILLVRGVPSTSAIRVQLSQLLSLCRSHLSLMDNSLLFFDRRWSPRLPRLLGQPFWPRDLDALSAIVRSPHVTTKSGERTYEPSRFAPLCSFAILDSI